jgi:hypothetical protein
MTSARCVCHRGAAKRAARSIIESTVSLRAKLIGRTGSNDLDSITEIY